MGIFDRLNPGSEPPAGGGGGEIQVDPAKLTQISGAAEDVAGGVRSDGTHAEEGSGAASRALGGADFALGDALAKTSETWGTQIGTLELACTKIADSLAATAKDHEYTEAENEMSMAEIAQHFE
ncbi:type VII secretion target [Saccharopolyspora cebuensis]|uniref:type VII secretion target n=1 Tax=Saccharopolyspora cebuensis TaxID=418759 RepID=UPI0031E71D36